MGKLGKKIVLMVKVRHICFMFVNSPRSIERILFKFHLNFVILEYTNNVSSNTD